MDNTIPENAPQKQCITCLVCFPDTKEFFYQRQRKLDARCKRCRCAYNNAIRLELEPKKQRSFVCETSTPKQCSKCNQELPATSEYFAVSSYEHGTLQRICKECQRVKYRADNPTPILVNAAPEGYKRCSVCRENIPATLEHFHVSTIEIDGLYRVCKPCRAQQRSAHRLTRLEKARAYDRAIRRKNVEYYRKYTKTNHEKIKARNRQHYWDKREEYLQYGKEYRKSHPEGRRVRDRNRRARKRAVGGTLTQADIQQQYQRQKGRCYYCKHKIHLTINGKAGYHADHVIPISKGGINDISNIVLACPTCNLKKGDKLLHQWPEGNRLL